MDKFQVIQPSLLLAPYVKQYWFLTMENIVLGSQRLVPLGCPVLSFHRGNSQSFLYGITTHYTDIVFSGNIDFILIVFQPAGARTFFGIPLSEINNSYISLDALGNPEFINPK